MDRGFFWNAMEFSVLIVNWNLKMLYFKIILGVVLNSKCGKNPELLGKDSIPISWYYILNLVLVEWIKAILKILIWKHFFYSHICLRIESDEKKDFLKNRRIRQYRWNFSKNSWWTHVKMSIMCDFRWELKIFL